MKKVLSLLLMIPVILVYTFLSFEPEIISADTTADVTVNLAVTSELSIACSTSTVQMTPSISGLTGGTANASTTCTVITNDTSGFNMTLAASTSPAMKCVSGGCNTGTDYFDNYGPASAGVPDYSWSVGSAAAEFGYTVEPETAGDTVQAFLDNGSNACNEPAGSNNADTCYLDASTTPYIIINRSSETAAGGEDEVIKFKAQSGSSRAIPEGAYQAVVTLTVAVNS